MIKRVDWKEFIEKEDYRSETLSQENYDKMVDKLLKDGILSLKPEGNYQLTGCGVVVSPRHSRLWRPVLYFTRKSDAVEYAKLNFSNAQYEVTVEKIEKLISEK